MMQLPSLRNHWFIRKRIQPVFPCKISFYIKPIKLYHGWGIKNREDVTIFFRGRFFKTMCITDKICVKIVEMKQSRQKEVIKKM
jgi:hypothetical protein